MASTFFLSNTAPTSAFTARPQFVPRTSVPRIAEPQHNDRYIDGDAPFLTEAEADLDISMSLGSAPNSPPVPTRALVPPSPVPMDISPARPRIASTVRFPSASTTSDRASTTKGLTGSALVKEILRSFGQDVANTSHNSSTSTVREVGTRNNSTVKSHVSASLKSTSSRSRAALPTAWMQQPVPTAPKAPESDRSKLARNRSQTMTFAHVSEESHSSVAWDDSIASDAMDLDGDVSIAHSATAPTSPVVAPLPTEFNELFFQPSSPVLASSSPDAKRRVAEEPEPEPESEHEEFVEFDLEEEIAHARQVEHELAAHQLSSPDKPALFSSSPPVSPSRPLRSSGGLTRPFERLATGSGQGSLFANLAPGQSVLPKPNNPFPRRPAVSAALKGEAAASSGSIPRPGALQPARRAFSASVTSSVLMMGSSVADNLGSDDSHCDFDGSPARAYATRKAAGPPMRRLIPSQPEKAMPKQGSPLTRVGLPGFGDNEADGKILPCHRVREDGLMRINPDTLDALLAGEYDSRINSFRIIDCRFDYEYEGGHVPGAINLNTTQAIEDFLLGPNKPAPSRSGDGTKKDILVFHCEFSVKRAPTFAKHLRSRDRAMNTQSYPKIHYPEVYVMAGGFSQYFKEKPSQVEPPYSYVRMDDPVHLRARHSDLNNFRRWERTKSYTYGEKQAAAAAIASGQAQMKRTGASADTESQGKRNGSSLQSLNHRMGHPIHGGSLSTLDEDGDSIYNQEDDLSPCPPPSAANYLRLAGKSRALERASSFGFAMTKR